MGCSHTIEKRRNEGKIRGSKLEPVTQFLDVFDSVCKIETSEKEGTGFLLKRIKMKIIIFILFLMSM